MCHVMHVISGLKVGGAEMALLRLAAGAQGGPYRHTVVALSSEGAMRQRFIDAGVDLTVIDIARSPLAGFWRLYRLVRQCRPDIVQTWMYHADLLGGLAAHLAGQRNVIWGIRTTELQRAGSSATAAVRKLCAMLSGWIPAAIVCVAEAARKTHVGIGYNAARMEVVPNGFHLFDDSPVRAAAQRIRDELGFGSGNVVIGCVGRFSDDKDQANFVRAAGLLAACRDSVRFLMIGRDVEAGNRLLDSWIKATGYPERFTLLGERGDVSACLAAMDVFCLSSRAEGFPNVVGEAMALAVPCVVTDVGDAALLVGETGMVVPAENPERLADALGRAVALQRSGRAAMGARAKARITQHFTVERTRARFEAIYQRMQEKGVH